MDVPRMSIMLLKRLLIVSGFLCSFTTIRALSNLTKNDPYPLYSTVCPSDLLMSKEIDYYKGEGGDNGNPDRIRFSISPFRQSAHAGTDLCKHDAEIGDLEGRWNMFGLFYPEQLQLCPSQTGTFAQDYLFGSILQWTPGEPCFSMITSPTNSDRGQQFGFFTVPVEYRKYGLRFQFETLIWCDFGLRLQFGVSQVTQTPCFKDLSCKATGSSCEPECGTSENSCCILPISCDCKKNVINRIMDQYKSIAQCLGLNVDEYKSTDAEDVRFIVFLRHIFPINENKSEWPYFFFTPNIAFEAIAPTANKTNASTLFGISSGNNGHAGLGVSGGFSLDFAKTIELAINASMTKWLARDYCNYPVVTQQLQAGIFPYRANLRLEPGTNFTFSALVNARNFLWHTSAYMEYVVVNHGKDCFSHIRVQPIPNSPQTVEESELIQVVTRKMHDDSEWRSHFLNLALNYDISPNFTIGLVGQIPIARTNAYRSSTILGSLILHW